MKITTLQFIYGLLISLQQLLFLFGNTTFAYLAFVGPILIIYLMIAIKRKTLFQFIKGKSSLGFFFTLYILLIIVSVFYYFEGDVFRWFVGLTPFILTIPILNISRYPNQQKNKINIHQLWAGIAWGSLIVLIITIVFGVIEGNRLSYGGISASTIGRNSIIIITFVFSQFFGKSHKKNKIFYYSILLLGFMSLLLSGSKSSIIAFLGIFSYLLLKLRLFSPKFIVLVSITIIILILTPSFDIFLKSIEHYRELEQAETFSGRIYIWENLNPIIEKRIWFGYGYNSPSLLLTTRYFDIWNGRDIIQAHNAWLQSLLNLGIAGTATLVILIISFYFNIKKLFLFSKESYIILFSIFTFLLIRGFTEASFTNGYSLDVFLFSIVFYQLIISTKSINNPKNHRLNAK